MAEALINHLGAGSYKAVSAGSDPTGEVHPKSIETLERHGIPSHEPRSKSWDEFEGTNFDLVITVCDAAAGQSCPIFFGKHEKLHWSTPDPAAAIGSEEDITAAFEEAFEILKIRVEGLMQIRLAKKNLITLVEQTKVMLRQHVSFEKSDLTGRMITYFIYKQLDHAMSVIKLDPSMDTVLIARTMIEGVINLTWVLEQPETRVEDWFNYSSVYDFNLLKDKESGGSFISDNDRNNVLENYEKNASAFLTKKGNRHHDNFRKGNNLSNISKDNTDLEYFYQNYKYFSDWVHWGSQSLRHVIDEQENEISYYEQEHIYRAPALVIAFGSLLDIVAKTSEHFGLEQDEALEEISNQMLEDLKNTGMKFDE